MDILVVVDMQNDFITGALGSEEALEILPAVIERIKSFRGRVLFTRDTHTEDYPETQEGKKLPVRHCIRDTEGWRLHPEIEKLRVEVPIDKASFGSVALGELLKGYDSCEERIESVTLIGLCTDICVISNAFILKAFLPEARIIVDSSCCAGATHKGHLCALEAMRACQMEVI